MSTSGVQMSLKVGEHRGRVSLSVGSKIWLGSHLSPKRISLNSSVLKLHGSPLLGPLGLVSPILPKLSTSATQQK